mmetsp:Transcript_3085/g.5758  ORF Transcript_3085/g.5758 Transcript_3085/m.5758 type:complete len:167 (-) Transcript_3085:2719-3219(-)
MENQNKHVRVGIGVLVKDSNCRGKIWAGIRKGSHGEGSLALPGGHLEMMESWEECAKREVQEETGLDICDVQYLHVSNDPMPQEGKHYITIFMSARCTNETDIPRNLEPHKCMGWSSYSWSDLKRISTNRSGDDPCLFGPLKNLVESNPQSVLDFLVNDKEQLSEN